MYAQQLPTISDTIGYVYAAERLANGQGLTYEDVNNEEFVPLFSLFAFQIRRSGESRFFLGFPPGFPLLLALGIWLTGTFTAIHYVVPFMAIIGLVATFYLGYLVSDGNSWVGLWAAFIVAVTPDYWEFGTAAWSEVPAMVVVTVGCLLYLLSQQAKRPLSQKITFSLLGSLFLIYSLFIRYANVTFLGAIGFYELIVAGPKIWQEKWRWPFYGAICLGLVGVLLFNHFYYGGILLSSYSPENGWYDYPAFSFKYALGPEKYNLIELVKTLWHNFSAFLLLVPIGCWLLPRPFRLLCISCFVSIVGLYGMYAFSAKGINARFVLPAFPFLAVTIAQVIVAVRWPLANWSRVGGFALLVLLGWPTLTYAQHLQQRNDQSVRTVNQIQNIAHSTTPEAVFLTYQFNDLMIYYGQHSVLNYRRIPKYDVVTEKYNYEMFEPCFRYVIDQLLNSQKQVLYIHDQARPLYNSFDILRRHYKLESVSDAPPVYQIISIDNKEASQLDKASCSL